MMHSGLYEYQVAARMVEIHDYAGCETEAYAPIVGSGINSTVLHYNKLDRKIDSGEIVLRTSGPVFRVRLRYHAHDSRRRKIHAAPARNLRNRSWRAERPRSPRSSRA